MRILPVKTASAEYPVHVGYDFLSSIGSSLRKITGKSRPKLFVLTSPEIWSLWGEQFQAALTKDFSFCVLFLPRGEQYKRLRQVERLAAEMALGGADRSSVLVAFGGGIIGDVGGFLAAIYMRGIDYVQIPTTLLAQVDSSVGGKTGVNLITGKNLVGSFHHPRAVFADVGMLRTLAGRELRAGLFESIKAGIIRDAKLFRFLEREREAILACDAAALQRVVSASVAMKAEVVGIDERESGLRMILNFGHTVGHAIEAATHYRKLLHGEAIAWGMLAALRISVDRGMIIAKDAARMEQIIHAYGPLPRFRARAAELMDATARDKKNRSGLRRFVLTTGIGQCVVVDDVTDAELMSAIAWVLGEASGQ